MQTSVAAYALGTLDVAERAEMSEHLRDCAGCRATLHPIAGLPGLLARISAAEAETGPAVPDARLFDRLVAAAVAERRHRRRVLAAAAATVLVLSGAGLGAATALRDGPEPAGRAVAATHGAVHAQVWLHPSTAGTGLELELSGVAPEQRCRLIAVDAAGHREVAATWEATYGGQATISGSTAIPTNRLTRLIVETLDHRRLVELEIPPSALARPTSVGLG